LYRMPLDGSGPSALRVSGSPVDQFSFLESEDDHLNVLVRSETSGDGMWGAEAAAGDVALMRVPLASFSGGSTSADPSMYRRIPRPDGSQTPDLWNDGCKLSRHRRQAVGGQSPSTGPAASLSTLGDPLDGPRLSYSPLNISDRVVPNAVTILLSVRKPGSRVPRSRSG